jgi:murein DD-endopeptidase MepM/ murein hydrolase activator NlpD
MTLRIATIAVAVAALAAPSFASAYGWPLRPFDRMHPIRGGFGDPRYHVGATGAVGSFHFGVDIVAHDGTAVFSVEPGYVHAYSASVTITSRTSREFGYWHIRPVVKTGTWVKRHQLLGYIRPGWGHVHFAERYRKEYKDPLRRGALTPFFDRTTPVVSPITLLTDTGQKVDPHDVTGLVSIVVSAYDMPPLTPRAPWAVARLAPAVVWWTLTGPGVNDSQAIADFGGGLVPNALYGLVYGPGTYQNKPNRPGNYIFWTPSFDTTSLPDGLYSLTVSASDTRSNIGTQTMQVQIANTLGTR